LLGKKATKVKDVFVKKGQKAEIEVPVEATIETPESGEEMQRKTRPEPVKVKNAPKVEVIKIKKVKKGPKKIVRKEKVFVR